MATQALRGRPIDVVTVTDRHKEKRRGVRAAPPHPGGVALFYANSDIYAFRSTAPSCSRDKIGKLISNHEEPTAFTKPGVQTMMYSIRDAIARPLATPYVVL